MSQSSRQRGSGVTGGRIAAVVLVALIVVFAILNSQSVRMHWLVTTTTTPLFVVIIIFAALGLLLGYILGTRSRGRG
ncbi:MAG TPA: lipopolysaccharide assembly protein LapA domain-containing protein [Solirubrobacteraceae bacterium]